jgi:hypothetical protein
MPLTLPLPLPLPLSYMFVLSVDDERNGNEKAVQFVLFEEMCAALPNAGRLGDVEFIKALMQRNYTNLNVPASSSPLVVVSSTSTCSSSSFIDINLQNSHYHSALFNVASHGHVRALRHVLSYPNVLVNQTTPENITALMVATQRGHEECVEILAKAGADVGSVDSRGRSAIMIAAQQVYIAQIMPVVKLCPL